MYNGDGLNFTVLGFFVVIGLLATVYGIYSAVSFLVNHLAWVN